MADNVLEQLADLETPPPPARLDTEVHGRLNVYLTANHFAELILRGLPFAMGHFAQALFRSAVFSVSGDYQEKKSDESAS
jgi:hypothetical protein